MARQVAKRDRGSLSPLIVALDLDTKKEVEALLTRLGSMVRAYKVGMKLYTRYGPELLKLLKAKRKQIFLDLKFHDIPNTVAEACAEATRHGVDMLTVHCSGGGEMLRAAVKACRESAKKFRRQPPLVLGVTVLTSMSSLKEIGINTSIQTQVLHLAQLARRSGLGGVVCSPQEISLLRGKLPRTFRIVTPGIRPAGSPQGDQKRVRTPAEAYGQGADALVVGRPIYQAADPIGVARDILAQIP